MKITTINNSILLLFLAASLTILAGTACQTAGNTNLTGAATANNTVNANKAVVVNSNAAAINANSMSGNSSNAAMNGNMSGTMSHDGMNHGSMSSSPNAASAPYDLQFLDTMAAHHQGAVEMAEAAEMKTQNAELKKFAHKIVDDQKKEIAQMKEWREKWFAGKPAAMNMEMSGMMDSMKGMDMDKMRAASGKEFDLMFLEMMTPHHLGAVTMSREALTRAEHPEIKTLANAIIKAQEAEIKLMADWKVKWMK